MRLWAFLLEGVPGSNDIVYVSYKQYRTWYNNVVPLPTAYVCLC